MRTYILLAIHVLFAFALSFPVTAAVPAAYTLGPEDGLSVRVIQHPEFSGEFLVPRDGVIDFPAVGPIPVVGKTLAELKDEYTKRLAQRLNKPEIYLTLQTPRAQRVYAVGAVVKSGVYDLKPGWRVTELLAVAGGLTYDVADCQAHLLRASDGQQVTVDLRAALRSEPTANLELQPGDVLTAERLEYYPVYVMGDVKQAGEYPLRAGLSVVEALALAGGFTIPKDEVRVTVLRGARELAVVNLNQDPANESALKDMLLQRGDVVRVDSCRTLSVTVSGQIKTPGVYRIVRNQGLVHVLTLAGGTLEDAALNRITIQHFDGRTEVVDAAPSMLFGAEAPPVTLASGDVILVAKSTERIVVLGAVNHPGYFFMPYGQKIVLTDALSMAGGPAVARSKISNIAILRMADAAGKQERIIVNAQDFLTKGAPKSNPEIKSGDIIFVPDKGETNWQSIFQAISSFGIVLNALR